MPFSLEKIKFLKFVKMMHVCSDKPEDDSLLNDYLKLLGQLNKQNKKTKLSEETWNEELSQMRSQISEENKQAENIVQSMILREKSIGVSITPRRKQQAIRNLQSLINKQTERIKKVSHVRLSYVNIFEKCLCYH